MARVIAAPYAAQAATRDESLRRRRHLIQGWKRTHVSPASITSIPHTTV